MMSKFFILILAFLTLFTFFAYSGHLDDGPVAIVLAGGGARGAYQVGVWKGLIDLGIEIGAIYGVSVGAINGAMMAMNNFEQLRDLWIKLEKSNVMSMSEEAERVFSGRYSLKDLSVTLGRLYEEQGINVSPLEQLLFQYIDEAAIRAGMIDFGLVTYSLTDSSAKPLYLDDIPDGLLVDYILASANFPLFQRKVIGDQKFVDGGVRRNMPVDMIDSDKFSTAVLVSLNMRTPQDFIDYLTGYSDYDVETIYISPNFNAGSLLNFETDNSIRLMKMGYLDCLRVYGELTGEDYYIYGGDPLKELFLSLDAEGRRTAAELLEIDDLPGLSYFKYDICYLRFIMQEILKTANSPIELIERFAERQDVEKLQLYSSEQFLDKTVEKYISSSHNSLNYNRFLDFMSYLSLESKYSAVETSHNDTIYEIYESSFLDFKEE